MPKDFIKIQVIEFWSFISPSNWSSNQQISKFIRLSQLRCRDPDMGKAHWQSVSSWNSANRFGTKGCLQKERIVFQPLLFKWKFVSFRGGYPPLKLTQPLRALENLVETSSWWLNGEQKGATTIGSGHHIFFFGGNSPLSMPVIRKIIHSCRAISCNWHQHGNQTRSSMASPPLLSASTAQNLTIALE